MSPHFITTARLDWNDQGTPVAAAFDDVYYSNNDGLAETRYVFLNQSGLPDRWAQHDRPLFVVAETGFGTGLNMLATWHAFINYRRQHPQGNAQRLHLISVEKFPLSHSDLEQALGQWPELSTLSERLLAEYPVAVNGCHRLWLDENVSLDLWLGDVAEVLPQMEAGLSGKVDAWYLDGFAPSKNPDMWTPELFQQLAHLARSGATLATFTAASVVRHGLTAAGFSMTRVKGYAHKRNMLTGVRCANPRPPYPTPWFWRRLGQVRHTVIVGAGIAGASLAYALTRRGQRVTLLEQHGEPAAGASGNRQAAVYPLLNGEHDTLSQIYLQAFLYGRRLLPAVMEPNHVPHDWCSVVQLAFNNKSSAKINNLLAQFSTDIVRPLTAEQVNTRTGISANLSGAEYPLAGWVCPFELTRALLTTAEQTGLLRCHYHTALKTLTQQDDSQWQLEIETSAPEASSSLENAPLVSALQADNVVLANGHQVRDWPQTRQLTISSVRGQVNYQPSTPTLAGLKTVVCYEGYLTPAWQGHHCVGASYAHDQETLDYQAQDEQDNVEKLTRTLPALDDLTPVAGAGRVSVRAVCRDHLPLVGAAPHKAQQLQQYQHMPQRHKEALPLAADYAGLYIFSGLGSRGLCTAPLLAEVLAAQLLDEPYPLTSTQLAALNPNRLWLRKLLKGKPVTNSEM
ncbi:MAG: bifunctional tRNA (5-methylaminomethyl-2-thiouridine)(34)-methyltransferase MnmD/FAD-dependent 5-carboxymethylaminomethyl-2-thiouridine(34) oxidoreductase MnmC [Oceanisphaera sp.]|uniref:bifunctional tRNA (5-methylaminomethyl-2-thiouridine)(34)-methyltransferase MnmD/FAD-dependent 5-carboxymethylaminomethyl-2-thiouridine(34) oxidoreductase MnmC n=1 Tax=Oceanisphaera sp. TaxID=1929979 RepID=UPI003C762A20